MSSTLIITGGAGFIGCAVSHLVQEIYDRVVVVDNMHPQIHPSSDRPAELAESAELIRADVRDSVAWDRILREVTPTAVLHLAAETGTGQSLTEATRHASVNVVGTTEMLDAFVRNDKLPERIALTSSRAVYGEGAWRDASGRVQYPGQRSKEMLERGEWDFPGLVAMPFDSRITIPHPTSIYGSTKLAQENILRSWSLSFDVVPVFFRLQNVYGAGQSLINPYTGIVSFFAQRARAHGVIPVYEDGKIVRDFVYIDDVARAVTDGLLHSPGNNDPYDIGSGVSTTILEVARMIAEIYDAPDPEINGMFRNGDVRAAWTTLNGSVAELDWKPKIGIRQGLTLLTDWIESQL